MVRKTRGRADSCPISTYNSEARVKDRVITSHSSLDLLVPDVLLSPECVGARGNPLTKLSLSDSECGMGGGWLRCGINMLQGHLQ
jgi:hypothetical protein